MGWHLHNNDANLFRPVRKEGGARGRLLFHKKRGRMPSLENAIWATPIHLLSHPPCSESSYLWSVFCCTSKLSARAAPFVGQLQNSPRICERRDSWGVVSYPNVEKGAIRNRRVRAHAPQRHRVRPRPYHLPWQSGVRHRRRP